MSNNDRILNPGCLQPSSNYSDQWGYEICLVWDRRYTDDPIIDNLLNGCKPSGSHVGVLVRATSRNSVQSFSYLMRCLHIGGPALKNRVAVGEFKVSCQNKEPPIIHPENHRIIYLRKACTTITNTENPSTQFLDTWTFRILFNSTLIPSHLRV